MLWIAVAPLSADAPPIDDGIVVRRVHDLVGHVDRDRVRSGERQIISPLSTADWPLCSLPVNAKRALGDDAIAGHGALVAAAVGFRELTAPVGAMRNLLPTVPVSVGSRRSCCS
jgi:hypothetical protein